MEKKKFKINPHIIFAIAAIVIIVIIVRKFWGFGNIITQDDIDKIPTPENAEIQPLDNFLPLMLENDGTFPEDDGVTTVVCFGNSPFSDDRNSSDNLCNLFAEATGATVYNCSMMDSYMASKCYTFTPEIYPMDAFSFYFLTTIFTQNNDEMVEQAFNAMSVPVDIEESVSLLQSIDFTTVDAIFIMYDGMDYIASHPVTNPDNFTDTTTFTGSLAAGVSLIQETYPWIRIIVMSPSYAYGFDENGELVSSDKKAYADYLSTYVFNQADTASRLGVTFLDNLYGSIHEDIAPQYLTDHLHLNLEGRKVIATRMEEALEAYTNIY